MGQLQSSGDLSLSQLREIQSIKRLLKWKKFDDGFLFRCETAEGNAVDVRLDLCSDDVFRLRMVPSGPIRIKGTPMVLKEKLGEVRAGIEEDKNTLSIHTSKLTIKVNKDPWELSAYGQDGSLVFREFLGKGVVWELETFPLGFLVDNSGKVHVFETIALYPDEHIYGLGEKFSDLDKRGQRIVSWSTEALGDSTPRSYKNIPFFMSTRGYGIFVNSSHEIVYDFGVQCHVSYSFLIKDSLMDYFFIYGPSFKRILDLYTEITGKAPVPPKWSFGLWMSRAMYLNRGEVEEVCRKLREQDIPCDVIHIDPAWLREGHWCDLEWNEEAFPNPKEMIEKLKGMGFKLSLWISPYVPKGTEMFEEGKRLGLFALKEDGSVYDDLVGDPADLFVSDRAFVDFSNPRAVRWFQKKIRKLLEMGVAVIKTDFGESSPRDAVYHDGKRGDEMHNLYPLLYNRCVFEAVEKFAGRGIVWGRSGYAGMQRYPVCWSGDPASDFNTMACVLRGGLSMGLSGVPFWSHDIGGFWLGEVTPELYVRWAQFGLFCSHSRCHGTTPREPWEFGDEALSIFRRYAKLRYRLIPYIYSCAHISHRTGLPMIRAMVLEYQEDPNCYDKDLQYMFGESFLVAPIFDESGKRNIYLPKGKWVDYWTKEEFDGPMNLTYHAPLERLPLFVKANSIIPMGPEMNYVGEKPFDPIELDIYLYDRAEFTLYDDGEEVTFRGERVPGRVIFEIGKSEKNYILRFNGISPPSKVTSNGEELVRCSSQHELEGVSEGWWCGPGLVLVRISAKGAMKITLFE